MSEKTIIDGKEVILEEIIGSFSIGLKDPRKDGGELVANLVINFPKGMTGITAGHVTISDPSISSIEQLRHLFPKDGINFESHLYTSPIDNGLYLLHPQITILGTHLKDHEIARLESQYSLKRVQDNQERNYTFSIDAKESSTVLETARKITDFEKVRCYAVFHRLMPQIKDPSFGGEVNPGRPVLRRIK